MKHELLHGVKTVTVPVHGCQPAVARHVAAASVVAGTPSINLRSRPIAVEVTIELEDWGKIVRVFEVPT